MVQDLREEQLRPLGALRAEELVLGAVLDDLARVHEDHAVRDLLGVTVVAGDYLPLDTKSANFDNIADAQAFSATVHLKP